MAGDNHTNGDDVLSRPASRSVFRFTRWTVAHRRHREDSGPSGENGGDDNGEGVERAVQFPRDDDASSLDGEQYPLNRFRTSKYTALSFLPVNLFEQFRRVANFYFLVIFIMQLIPGVSPYPIIITVLPLTFILGVTALKEGWEDWFRHKFDAEVNAREVKRWDFSLSRTVPVRSDALRVGDVVEIHQNETSPADVLLLSSTGADVHVDTASLDGESRLKLRRCVFASEADAITKKHKVVCDAPSPWLERFQGKIDDIPLSRESLFVRGALLRNTPRVLALVLYTGPHTKLHLNQQKPRMKFSQIERRLNRCLATIFAFQAILCIVLSFCTLSWDEKLSEQIPEESSDGWMFAFLTWFILFSYMVPMSLYVVLEFGRFASGLYIQWDATLSSEAAARAISSSGVEELGEIDVVLSDKTGTLTRNSMHLTKIASRGESVNVESFVSMNEDVEKCLLIMVICNDLTVNGGFDPFASPSMSWDIQNVSYHGESPDEVALAYGAKNMGVALVCRAPKRLCVRCGGCFHEYEILGVLPFSPVRKRMGMVVRRTRSIANGKVEACEDSAMFLIKGADSTVLRLCREDEGSNSVEKSIDTFSKEGLRTLVLAESAIETPECLGSFKTDYMKAAISMGDRDADIETAFRSIETDLHVVGATGVEDALAENVPLAIQNLVKAKVQVVVLTGDKTETAVNICVNAHLISDPKMIRYVVHEERIAEDLAKLAGGVDKSVALVISGTALRAIFQEKKHTESFSEILPYCYTIICTRMTPAQKATVVRFYKTRKAITLAIGDGANDVSMIREAHVGVGILGKEGSQAANAADFALSRFSDLTRLLFVHGRYAHVRVVDAARASTFANMAFNLPLLFFGFINGYSAQSMYSSMVLTVFNLLFTGIVYLAIVFFDRQLDDTIAMQYPQIYACVRGVRFFGAFSYEMLLAAWYAAVAFFAYASLSDDVLVSDGEGLGMWGLGAVANMVTVPSLMISYALRMRCFTWLHWASLGIGMLAFLAILFVTPFWFTYTDELWGFPQYAFHGGALWLWALVLITAAVLPQAAVRCWGDLFYPDPWLVVREKETLDRRSSIACACQKPSVRPESPA